jgi:predicted N-acyltransferase
VEQHGQLQGLAPAWLKSHSRGEYVFDWAWAEAWQRAGLDYYPKLLLASPFTPVTGQRLLGQGAARPC